MTDFGSGDNTDKKNLFIFNIFFYLNITKCMSFFRNSMAKVSHGPSADNKKKKWKTRSAQYCFVFFFSLFIASLMLLLSCRCCSGCCKRTFLFLVFLTLVLRCICSVVTMENTRVRACRNVKARRPWYCTIEWPPEKSCIVCSEQLKHMMRSLSKLFLDFFHYHAIWSCDFTIGRVWLHSHFIFLLFFGKWKEYLPYN